MNYIDAFRNPDVAAQFVKRIAEQGRALAEKGLRVHVMEVCGSHTMAIERLLVPMLKTATPEAE